MYTKKCRNEIMIVQYFNFVFTQSCCCCASYDICQHTTLVYEHSINNVAIVFYFIHYTLRSNAVGVTITEWEQQSS